MTDLGINLSRMSDDAGVVIQLAQREAARRHAIFVDGEHLALGLLSHHGGVARRIFEANSVDTDALYDRIATQLGMERAQPAEVKGLSSWLKTLLERATHEAQALGHQSITDGHLLLALLMEREGIVIDALHTTSLTEYGVRVYLRDRLPASETVTPPETSERRFGPGRPLFGGRKKETADRRPNRQRRGRPVIVVDPNRPRGTAANQMNNNRLYIIAGILGIIAVLLYALPTATVFTVVFIFAGWVFSVTLHEFGHALVAYWGGDYTVKDKGYLSFNPLKYTHPMLSIYLPLIFLLMGGIGLPGGAVYIERHRLKNEWWGAAVSAAGPIANLLFAILLALPFATGLVDADVISGNLWFSIRHDQLSAANNMTDTQLRARYGVAEPESIWDNEVLWSAVATLAMLQVTAVFFNLLPIPPLDGSGIIEPFLDPKTRFQFMQIGQYGLMIVFFAFWFITPISHAFWEMVWDITDALGVPSSVANTALIERFLFWRN